MKATQHLLVIFFGIFQFTHSKVVKEKFRHTKHDDDLLHRYNATKREINGCP